MDLDITSNPELTGLGGRSAHTAARIARLRALSILPASTGGGAIGRVESRFETRRAGPRAAGRVVVPGAGCC
jgi:hypothetical protein